MREGVEAAPRPIPAETARLFQSIFFWSFFFSQGSETVQNRLFRYVCLAEPSLVDVLPHVERDDTYVTYSASFVQDIIQPAIERINKYITRSTHKKIGHASVLQEIMGQDPETDYSCGRSRGVLFEFVRHIESAQKYQLSARSDLMGEQLTVIAKHLLIKDHEWMTEKIRDAKKGRTVKAPFNDRRFSHLCHFGFLKQPLPRDCPAVFRRLFSEIPTALLRLARTDVEVATKLKVLVQRHNDFHPTEQVTIP